MRNRNRERAVRASYFRRQAQKIAAEHKGLARVEAYLQRAMQAEQKAATGSEEFRQDMIDLATQWRDLAGLAN